VRAEAKAVTEAVAGAVSEAVSSGEREIGLEYVEALLAAVDLEVRQRDETASSAR
jgi:hypothetical protein